MSKHSQLPFFSFESIQELLNAHTSSKPRGESLKLSKALGVHTTLISQVQNGRKDLTMEQASLLCDYLKLNTMEADYLISLCQLARAGNESLKKIILKRVKEIRKKSKEIKHRISSSHELSDEDKAIYYSTWHYSYIRLLTSIKGLQNVKSICDKTNLSKTKVEKILSFLVNKKLCKKVQGKFLRTDQNTHIDPKSMLINRHHQNWRARSIELLEREQESFLSFTSPLTIAERDIPKIKELLIKNISEISKVVKDSPCEKVVYLGIDLLDTH